MNKQHINRAFIEATMAARDAKGVKNTDIAEATGKKAPWVSKFFSGLVRTISESDMHALEELLGIQYFSTSSSISQQSPLARKIAAAVDSDDNFAKAVAFLHAAMGEAAIGAMIPEMSQPELVHVGTNITEIVTRWKGMHESHYQKIGSDCLSFLRGFCSGRR